MSARQRLTPHPRLYLRPDDIDRLKHKPELPFLRRAAEHLVDAAERFVRSGPVPLNPDTHNGHLIRARNMQTRVVSLLARFAQTGADRYRRAVLACVGEMNEWEHWSWIAWRSKAARDECFDLSYGENSTTLAIAYTWLHDTLSASERELFIDTARGWAFASALKRVNRSAFWFAMPDSNWNAVCAGGLGMLALAMFEDAPEPAKLLPRCEQSIKPFMHFLDKTDGAWPEGLGYWNYGMRYAFMYLLSHEAATGRKHPLMKLRGVRKTLSFPLEFSPGGCPCGFGDVNQWDPMPFHYAAARRLKCSDVLARLDERSDNYDLSSYRWPSAAEWLMLHPGRRTTVPRQPNKRPVAHLYKGLDWGVLADHTSSPNICATVRGGTTNVPHGHRDLLSFHVVIGGEQLITDIKPAEYLDTTFSPRRDELFEVSPASKNTIFINGVGITSGSELKSTTQLKLPGAVGFRLDASGAFGTMRDGAVANFCARAVLLLKEGAILVVDRVELPFAGRVESRLHTFARVRNFARAATIRGQKQACRVTFASDVPALLMSALTSQTTPTSPPAQVLRWCTGKKLHHTVTLAALITPGAAAARLELHQDRKRILLEVSTSRWKQTVTLTGHLRPSR